MQWRIFCFGGLGLLFGFFWGGGGRELRWDVVEWIFYSFTKKMQ